MGLFLHHKETVAKIVGAVHAGHCCRVLGARFRYKSDILKTAAASLEENGSHVVYLIEIRYLDLSTEATFFSSLFQKIVGEDAASAEGQQISNEIDVIDVYTFQFALNRLVARSPLNVALFLDNIEMAPPNFAAFLLGSLRAVYSKFSDHPEVRFQAVVCGSLSLNQVALDNASRFESVSKLVRVEGLDHEDRRSLAMEKCRESGLTFTHTGIETLVEQTGGDPYLIKELVLVSRDLMAETREKQLLPHHVEAAVGRFLERDNDWIIEEVLLQIDTNPIIFSGAVKLLASGMASSTELRLDTEEEPTPLDLCGAFSRTGDEYRIKSPIWEALLRNHLNDQHVGHLYAISGEWSKAIEFLGRAVDGQDDQSKMPLFTAVINGMHSVERVEDALHMLGEGLDLTYRDQMIKVWYSTGTELIELYPKKGGTRIYQNQPHQEEIKGLNGPLYSLILNDEEKRIYIPLRPGPSDRRTIGLIQIDNPQFVQDTRILRQEMRQLSELARQAAKVLESKGTFQSLLQQSQSRAGKLHDINSLLTRILSERNLSEELIFRLMLAWVTVEEGLAFNRAILFLPNEAQDELIGYYGVGQLKYANAKTVWESTPKWTLDQLINHILETGGDETELNEQVQSLRISIGGNDNFLADVYQTGGMLRGDTTHLFLNVFGERIDRLPKPLMTILGPVQDFALVPLQTGRRPLGILYVDRHYSGDFIEGMALELLQTFVNQVALAVENVRALRSEEQQKEKLKELLAFENATSSKIFKSVRSLMDELVESARLLIDADLAVIYPLRQSFGDGQYFFEVDQVAFSNTRFLVEPEDKPRGSGSLTYQVVENGFLLVPDTDRFTAADGREIGQVPFIENEEVKSFVAVRLGSRQLPVGILFISWRSRHHLTSEETTLIEIFANYAGVAITGASQHERVKSDLARRDQEITGLSGVIYAGLDPGADSEEKTREKTKEVIRWALQTAEDIASTDYVFLIRNEPMGLWSRHWLDRSKSIRHSFLEEMPQGVIRDAFESGKTQIVTNGIGPSGNRFRHRLVANSRSALSIPVKVGLQQPAVLHLESEALTFDSDDQAFVERLADRLAISLKQSEHSQTLRRLLDISLKLTQPRSLEKALRAVVDQAMEGLYFVDMIILYHINGEGEIVLIDIANSHLDQETAQVTYHPENMGTILKKGLRSSEPIFVESLADHREFRHSFPEEEGFFSMATFPLIVDQVHVGSMIFNYRYKHIFDYGEESLLKLFAQLAAVAIQYADIHQKAETRGDQLGIVEKLARNIANLDQETIVSILMTEIKAAVPQADNLCIIEYDGDREEYGMLPFSRPFYNSDRAINSSEFRDMRQAGFGIARRVIEEMTPERVDDVSDDPDYYPSISTTRSELCVPIQISDTKRGAIVLESNERAAFKRDDEVLMQMISDHVAIALRNSIQYQELKNANRWFEEAKARDLLMRSTTLATGLIHEINSVVANIPDWVTEIKEKLSSESEVRASAPLNDLSVGATKAGQLSTRLRAFLVDKNYRAEKRSILEVVSEVVEEARFFKPKHIAISVEVDPELEIEADFLWVTIMLQNIIANALDHIPADRDGKVLIVAQPHRDRVAIVIEDNGHGIPEDKLEKIFEPGYSSKRRQFTRITGIGLFVCRKIAEDHGGMLTAESELGEWSRFTLELPFKAKFT